MNPVSEEISRGLCTALKAADADPDVLAIVLTGGPDRSFSAGGDFAELSSMTEPESVAAWIERTIDLYISVLSVNKPVVMAVDGYAIGIGMQLALMGDWRVAGKNSQFSMWELKKGVACTIGACILQRCVGRLATTRIIYGCETFDGLQAQQLGLVEDLVPSECLETAAIERAEQLGAYPAVAFRKTKQAVNAPFIKELRLNARVSREAHIHSFQSGEAGEHMRSILTR